MNSLLARLLLIVAVALTPALCFQAYTEHEARHVRQQLMEEEVPRLVRFVRAEQQRILEGAEEVLNVISSTSAVQRNLPELCEQLVADVLARSPRYDNLSVIDLNGHRICAPGQYDRAEDLSSHSFFRLALQTGGFAIGEYAATRGAKPTIDLAKPFQNPDGAIAGVVVISLNLEWLGQQFAHVPLPPDALATIADRNGTILARYPDAARNAGQAIPARNRFLLEGNEIRVTPITGQDGRARLAAFSPVGAEPLGLFIGVGLDSDAAFASVTRENRVGILLIAGGGLLALGLTALVGTRLIRRPVNQLLTVAEQWRTGALNVRTGLRKNPGEFGRLAVAFDDMAEALEAREAALRNALESTTDTVIVLDRDWRYTYLNQRAKIHFAQGRDLVGQVIWNVFPAAAAGVFGEAYRRAMDSGLPTHAESYFVPLGSYWEVHAYPSSDGLTVFARDVTEQRRIAAALHESEALFGAAFDQASVGMTVMNCAGTTLRVNDKLCEITGYTREELLDRPFHDITHPDDRTVDRAEKDRMLTGETETLELTKRYLRKDGTIVRVRIIGFVMRAADGGSSHFFGVVEDITERNRIEAALLESEQRLRLAVEAARLGVRELDLVTNESSWTPEAARILGSDYPGDPSFDAWVANIHPDDHARVQAAWDRTHADPSHYYEAEYRFRQPDGGWRWIAAYGRTMFEAGRAIRWISVVQDISARKQVQEALQESETRLQLAREAAGFGVWDWDVVTGKRIWSAEQWRLYGFEPQPGGPTSKTWRSRLHPDDSERVFAEFAAAVAAPTRPLNTHYRVLHSDGLYRWLMVRAKVLRGTGGEALRMVGLCLDVTETRDTETQLRRLTGELEARVQEEVAAREAAQVRAAHAERMQALGQLAGGIAHDFNNVLQAVSGAMTLIERRPGDQAGIRRLARLAGEATDRGASITRRLLAFGRRGDLRAEPIDPGVLLHDLREILAHTLGANIDVRVTLNSDLRPFLADKGQLETSLINLSTNARDAMPNGGKLILSAAVETVAAEVHGHPDGIDPGRYIRLTIQDTGVGMDAATLARASEPFFTTKKIGAGTGLGLAMAKGFAEQSGGGLKVESTPGRGTTITLWLPETDPAALQSAKEPRDHAGTVPNESEAAVARVRILLVDDENAVREVLALHLEDAGFAVLAAASGTEALALLAAGEKVDALVTDLSMPGIDGLAVIRAVQERYRNLPAVLLTGYAGDGASLAVGGAVKGTFTLLRKPVRAVQLIDRLQALLAGRTDAYF